LGLILSRPNIRKCFLITRYNNNISYKLEPFVAINRVGGAAMRIPSKRLAKTNSGAETAKMVLSFVWPSLFVKKNYLEISEQNGYDSHETENRVEA